MALPGGFPRFNLYPWQEELLKSLLTKEAPKLSITPLVMSPRMTEFQSQPRLHRKSMSPPQITVTSYADIEKALERRDIFQFLHAGNAKARASNGRRPTRKVGVSHTAWSSRNHVIRMNNTVCCTQRQYDLVKKGFLPL